MYKLIGNTPYEQVSSAKGRLAGRLMKLIEAHGEDARVYQLATEYVEWYALTFNDSKDSIGRDIWDRVDELMVILDAEVDGISPATGSATRAIGKCIGRLAATTINAGSMSGKWIRHRGAPAVRDGAVSMLSGAKEGYLESRSRRRRKLDTDAPVTTADTTANTNTDTDEEVPY